MTARLAALLVAALALLLLFAETGLAFAPSTRGATTRGVAGRLAAKREREREPRWASGDVDDFSQRLESGKVAVLSAVAGSVGHAPLAIVGAFVWGDGLSAGWEFNTDALAVTLALFGVVYRYATRKDGNVQLKQGVVGAFTLTRTLNMVSLPETCTPLPLNCGAPLGYLSWQVIQDLVLVGGGSLVAFGIGALAIEAAYRRGLIQRMS